MASVDYKVTTIKLTQEDYQYIFDKTIEMSKALNQRVTISDIIRLLIHEDRKGKNGKGDSGLPQIFA